MLPKWLSLLPAMEKAVKSRGWKEENRQEIRNFNKETLEKNFEQETAKKERRRKERRKEKGKEEEGEKREEEEEKKNGGMRRTNAMSHVGTVTSHNETS